MPKWVPLKSCFQGVRQDLKVDILQEKLVKLRISYGHTNDKRRQQ
jgi:hypothetical protein